MSLLVGWSINVSLKVLLVGAARHHVRLEFGRLITVLVHSGGLVFGNNYSVGLDCFVVVASFAEVAPHGEADKHANEK